MNFKLKKYAKLLKLWVYLTGLLIAFQNCSSGGFSSSNGSSSLGNQTLSAAIPVVNFSVNNSSINSGSSATLAWTVSNATSCLASGGAFLGNQQNAGTLVVTPAATTVYTLMCLNSIGSASQTVTVTVISSLPSVTIAANPSSVLTGASTQLTWAATNATSCTASGAWSGTQAISGTASKTPASGSNIYTLTCTGPGGSTVQSVTVTAAATITVPVVTLTASSSTITSGASTTLTWSASGASTCTPTGFSLGSAGAASGSVIVSPTATTTYSLTCSDSAGNSAPQSVTVTVNPPLPVVAISASLSSIVSGSSSIITWSATNATSCAASGAWSGTKAASGTLTVSPTLTSTYTLTCADVTGNSVPQSTTVNVTTTAASSFTYDKHILVDQFGYRPNDSKVAVIKNPHIGIDSNSPFAPGATYQLRSAVDNSVVFSGTLTAWNAGTTDSYSGDSGWWFDFSSVTTPGQYYVADLSKNLRSASFTIAQNVYKNVLVAATRMYFYQRSGMIKTAANAGDCWADQAAYVGTNQDLGAADITDPTNTSKFRDVSGGWFDAGDTNKYVTFARDPVQRLLSAYQNNPAVFTDDFNIPESGNGVPDVLDEVNWEIQWLIKMQNSDGSAALKVGVGAGNFPSGDPALITNQRFYIPTCTSSTIAVAGMFAHAAVVFNQFVAQAPTPHTAAVTALATEATNLQTRAINAWNNYQSFATAGTLQTSCDTGKIEAGNADWSARQQGAAAGEAAIYLFALTGNAIYNNYLTASYTGPAVQGNWLINSANVSQNYQLMEPYFDMAWSIYTASEGEALLYYASLPNANATLAATIKSQHAEVVTLNPVTKDLYRNYFTEYWWGSNQYRSNFGNTGISDGLEVLHYMHGVNPFAMVYMTNMYSYGATFSVDVLYHTWFSPGTKWSTDIGSCGPAPGYLPGGPNESYDGSDTPPKGQPPAKSYWASNLMSSPDNVWEVSEPGIYYQAAFVKLLSNYAQ